MAAVKQKKASCALVSVFSGSPPEAKNALSLLFSHLRTHFFFPPPPSFLGQLFEKSQKRHGRGKKYEKKGCSNPL